MPLPLTNRADKICLGSAREMLKKGLVELSRVAVRRLQLCGPPLFDRDQIKPQCGCSSREYEAVHSGS